MIRAALASAVASAMKQDIFNSGLCQLGREASCETYKKQKAKYDELKLAHPGADDWNLQSCAAGSDLACRSIVAREERVKGAVNSAETCTEGFLSNCMKMKAVAMLSKIFPDAQLKAIEDCAWEIDWNKPWGKRHSKASAHLLRKAFALSNTLSIEITPALICVLQKSK